MCRRPLNTHSCISSIPGLWEDRFEIYIYIYTRGSSGSCLERINALARSEIRDSGKMDGKKGKGEKRIFRFFERNHHLFFLFRVVNFQYDIINVRKSLSDLSIAAFRSRWREGEGEGGGGGRCVYPKDNY